MAILGNMKELVDELGRTVNALGEFRKGFEEVSRLAAQTGREDIISRGAFIDQFKDTGASFKEATGIFKQSLNVGVAGNAANLELITDISRLGLNVGAFSEILATTQQVFGLNAEASIAFTESVAGAGRQFNIAGDKFAELIKSLQQTLQDVSVQFRGDAFKSFSEAAVTLAGSIGPTAIGGIDTILSKVTGTTQDSFARLALLGVDPGAVGRVAAGGDTQATLAAITDVAQAAVTLAEQFGVGGPNADPRLLGEFTRLTGFTAQDLLISEKILESSNMGFEALNEQAAEEGRRSQRSRDLTEAFNRLVFNLQDRLFTFFEGLTGGSEAFAEKLSGFGDQFLNAIGATEENFRALGQNIRTFIEGDGFGKLTANIVDITETVADQTVATFKGIADATETFVGTLFNLSDGIQDSWVYKFFVKSDTPSAPTPIEAGGMGSRRNPLLYGPPPPQIDVDPNAPLFGYTPKGPMVQEIFEDMSDGIKQMVSTMINLPSMMLSVQGPRTREQFLEYYDFLRRMEMEAALDADYSRRRLSR